MLFKFIAFLIIIDFYFNQEENELKKKKQKGAKKENWLTEVPEVFRFIHVLTFYKNDFKKSQNKATYVQGRTDDSYKSNR